MKVLSYSPSAELYAEVAGGKYYDLSQDIVSLNVTRKIDATSRWSCKLQNKGGKYNDLFSPMDKVVIYMTKTSRHKILTGYITSADKFTLYGQDMSISGTCTFHQLEVFYWDSALVESQMLLRPAGLNSTSFDCGYWQVVYNLLTGVAGWSEDQIKIESSLPSGVLNWAKRLYEAKLEDLGQLKDMANEFYEILQTSGPMLGGNGGDSSGGSADFTGNDAAEKIWNFCKSQGFSDQAAAATIGNAMQESGCNPACMQSGGGPGRGLFQWEIGSDRYSRLVQIATGMGKQWSDIEPQLTLFQEEAEGCFKAYTGKTYTYPNGTQTWWPQKVSYSEWKQWTNIEQATDCLERVYMRPSMPRRERRQQSAREAYQKYAK